MKLLEIEFKYRTEVGLQAFRKLLEARGPKQYIQASGFDRFYESDKEPEAFARHRVEPGKFNQLSFKRKHAEKNNYIRTEHNIGLSVDTPNGHIKALCAEFGYKYNCSIFKNCFIYKFTDHTVVYYVCYDEDMKELGRFVEIELCEEKDWPTQDYAMERLEELERDYGAELDFGAKNRAKRSLFEMFRKETR